MNCPTCGSPKLTPNDKESHRFKCLACGQMINPSPKKRGAKALGEKAMTNAEKKRRSRLNQRVLKNYLRKQNND